MCANLRLRPQYHNLRYGREGNFSLTFLILALRQAYCKESGKVTLFFVEK